MTRGQRVWVRFLAHSGLPTDNRWRPAVYLKEWTDRRGRKWHQVALVEERAIFDVREIRTSPPTAAARRKERILERIEEPNPRSARNRAGDPGE